MILRLELSYPFPHVEKIGISLVDYIHAFTKVEFVLREFFVVGGPTHALVQIQQLRLHACIAIYHHMGSNTVGVVIGSSNLNLYKQI